MKTDDALRPAFSNQHFVVWLLPGLVAVAPYVFVLNHYYPLAGAWKEHELAVLAGIIVAASLVGILLESVGGWVEAYFDRRIARRYHAHLDEWWAYLAQPCEPETHGVRYLRTRVQLLKFEIGLAEAILLALVGFWWAFFATSTIGYWTAGVLTLLGLGLTAYLIWDSYQVGLVLSELRSVLVARESPAAVQE